MGRGTLYEFYGSIYLENYQRRELAEKDFIRILHMRTFHYNNSTSEVHLPKISKERIFEIDTEPLHGLLCRRLISTCMDRRLLQHKQP